MQVDAAIALTGNTFSMSLLAFVVPAGTLPKKFQGRITGTIHFLGSGMVPRKVLHAFDTPVAEDLWVIIRMKRFADSRA